MNVALWLLTVFTLALCAYASEPLVVQITSGSYDGLALPTPPSTYASSLSNDTSRPDTMIVRCYNTLCRDWMHECHWFCDKGKSGRCMECLSWRGQHCYDCFKLL